MVYCGGCGQQLHESAPTCPNCGAVQKLAKQVPENVSPKSRLIALLLCLFLGVFGIHRFYVGKAGTGVLMLVTLGLLGFWTLIDFIMILIGSFKDADSKWVTTWS